MEKCKTFQQMMVGQLNIHVQKDDFKLFSYTLFKKTQNRSET